LPPRKNDPQKLARGDLDEGNGLEFLDWQTLIEGYAHSINKKSPSTTIVYRRTLRQFAEWLSALPGHQAYFRPEQLTRAAFESYLAQLDKRGYSVSYTLKGHKLRLFKGLKPHFVPTLSIPTTCEGCGERFCALAH